MTTAFELVGTVPRLQFPAVVQLLSPASPFYVSVVSGGGAFDSRAAAVLAAGCWLAAARCESLRFEPACAKAMPIRLENVASRQRTIIDRVTTREDTGRMGDSI